MPSGALVRRGGLVVVAALLLVAAASAEAGARWSVQVAGGSGGQARAGARPPPPATVTATCVVAYTSAGVRSDSIRVDWSPSSTATTYDVEHSYLTSDGQTWSGWGPPPSAQTPTGVVGTSFTDTNTEPSDLTFRYRVNATRGTYWWSAPTVSGTRTITNGRCS